MGEGRVGEAGRAEGRWPPVLMALFAVLFWAVPFLGFTPPDYGAWTGPWYREIIAEGRVSVFAEPFGNYTPPYLYLLSAATLLDGVLPPLAIIKLLSTAGAAWVAVSVYTLLRASRAPDPAKAALWSLLLPTIIFNVPILTQADPFWLAPCVLATAAAVRGDSLRTAVWAGVAVAFKAQAVFIAPFVMAFLLQRRAPVWCWAIPALIYAGAMVPAWLAGWPARDLLLVYVKQATYTKEVEFVSNAANLWHLFRLADLETAVRSFWAGYLLAGFATLSFIAWFVRRQFDAHGLIAAAMLSALMLPWLLPGMHERFFALAEILAFCLAWSARDRNAVMLAVLMQTAAAFSVGGWLFNLDPLPLVAIGLVIVAAFMVIARVLAFGRLADRDSGARPEPPLWSTSS